MKQIVWSLIFSTALGIGTLSAELGSQKIAALRRQLEACDSHKKRLIESDLAAQSKNAEAQKKLKIMHTLLNEVCDAEEKSGRASAACERYRLHCARETTKNKQEFAKLSKEIAALDKKLPELRKSHNEFIASRERTLAECAHAIGNSLSPETKEELRQMRIEKDNLQKQLDSLLSPAEQKKLQRQPGPLDIYF